MIQEIQNKIEQAAKAEIDNSVWSNHDDSLPLNVAKNALVRFAQTILENPGEWGLEYSTQTFKYALAAASQHAMENELMQSQLTKYREALETILEFCQGDDESSIVGAIHKEAKEALKQQ